MGKQNTKDTPNFQTSPLPTGGIRLNSGKLKTSLLPYTIFELLEPDTPLVVLKAIINVMIAGHKKYDKRNYEKGLPISETIESGQRHLFKHSVGELLDNESGLPHLDHAISNVAMIHYFFVSGIPGLDDRDDISQIDLSEISSVTLPYFFEKHPIFNVNRMLHKISRKHLEVDKPTIICCLRHIFGILSKEIALRENLSV